MRNARSLVSGMTAVAALVAAAASGCFAAELRLGSPFCDNMVLQRDREVPVWGRAEPGSKVTVEFAGQSVSAVTASDGRWRLSLKPLAASKEPRRLTVTATSQPPNPSTSQPLNLPTSQPLNLSTSLTNVVVGEVWIAAGQSNMELPLWSEMPRYRDEHGAMMAQATHLPNVRFGAQPIPWKCSDAPREFTRNEFRWMCAEPENLRPVRNWSAIAFWFARELYLALDVPVGVIGLYQGGTRIGLWTAPSALDDCGVGPDDPLRAEAAKLKDFGGLFNEYVTPVAPYAARGLLWYQGCANGGFNYANKMRLMYRSWAKAFAIDRMPMYYVQIPGGDLEKAMEQSQFLADRPECGMVVVNDVANAWDVHPARKEIVAKRLVLHALRNQYGFKDVTAASPKPLSATVEGDGAVRVKFANAKSLYLYNDDFSMANDFQIAGADGKFLPATILNVSCQTNAKGVVSAGLLGAQTKTPELVLGADGVKEPRRVRYLANRPWKGNVFSEVNLPLEPFVMPVLGQRVPDVKWKPVFADEFDGAALDEKVWKRIPTPNGGCSDWDRHMSAREDLVTVADGICTLWGKANDGPDRAKHPWVTGGIWNRRGNPATFVPRRGKAVIRARFHDQKGAWPAIWLMPALANDWTDGQGRGWPWTGEVDVIERLNSDPFVYQTCHSGWTNGTRGYRIELPRNGRTAAFRAGEFNDYGVEFEENRVVWSVNGTVTHVYERLPGADPAQWPFDHPWHFLIDMQLGGNWVGEVDLSTLPVRMEIDFVRVYERPDFVH